jgi:hypothetical protein
MLNGVESMNGALVGRASIAVHLLNVSDDHDVDRGFMSSETEYFV